MRKQPIVSVVLATMATVLVSNTGSTQSWPTFVKGIHHEFECHKPGCPNDFLPDIKGNAPDRVAVLLWWPDYRPDQNTQNSGVQCAYGGVKWTYGGITYCASAPHVDEAINEYATPPSVPITAVVVGAPAWARDPSRICGVSSTFCAPAQNKVGDFGAFVEAMASKYQGKIDEFVIWNEVNQALWFDPGGICPLGSTCPPTALVYDALQWKNLYSSLIKASYDALRNNQFTQRVLLPVDHWFGADAPNSPQRYLGANTILLEAALTLGYGNDWGLAVHPYSAPAQSCSFSVNDWNAGYATAGALGRLTGWLRQAYWDRPNLHTVALTEYGYTTRTDQPNSCGTTQATAEAAQSTALCNSVREAIATPGVEGFIFQRYIDRPVEDLNQLWGLRRQNAQGLAGDYKPAWATWALMNRGPGYDSCGFENKVNGSLATVLKRYYNPVNGAHWVTTRTPEAGYNYEMSWKLLRAPVAGTQELYECHVAGTNNHFISKNWNCESTVPMGSVGYSHIAEVLGTVRIHRCYNPYAGTHLVSPWACPPGWNDEGDLGWVYPN